MMNPQPNKTVHGNLMWVFNLQDEVLPGALLDLKVIEPQQEVGEEQGTLEGKAVYEVFQEVI